MQICVYIKIICIFAYIKTQDMKIIRKQFADNSELISKSVIRNSASRKDWLSLLEKCGKKCGTYSSGIPMMTYWKNKVSLRTRAGHHFQFEFVQ